MRIKNPLKKSSNLQGRFESQPQSSEKNPQGRLKPEH